MASPKPGLLDDWQRLSPWAIGLIMATTGVSLLRQHLPLLLAASAALTISERAGWREVLLGGSFLALGALLLSLRYYHRFRFRFDGEVLVVQKGLLVHREFKVSARHVQQTSRQQPAWMRPFGVVQWEVETLAGEAASIALPGIRGEVAEALEARLRGSTSDDTSGAEKVPPDASPNVQVRFTLTPGALVLHGLASRSILVVVALISPLVRPLESWLHHRLPHVDLWGWLPASPMLALGVGLSLVVMILMLLSVLAAWWRFHGFVLRDEGERQVQVSGLFHRRSQTLSRRRLQVMEWVQSGLGRVLGRGYLVCHQFGAAGGGEVAEARRFLVPGLTAVRADALAPALWRKSTSTPSFIAPLRRVSSFYRRVLFLRLLLLLSIGLLMIWQFVFPAWPGWILGVAMPGLVVISLGLAQLRWHALGWGLEGDWLRVRQGLWGQRTSLFPLDHLVSLQLKQSWLQRRRGLMTLHLHLASGRLTLPYLDVHLARELADRLLASVESITEEFPEAWPHRSDGAARR